MWAVRNNARSTLAAAVDSTTATFRLNLATAPYRDPITPGAGNLGTMTLMDDLNSPGNIEIIWYEKTSAGASEVILSGVVRGREATSARAWPVSSPCFMALTAKVMQDIQDYKEPLRNVFANADFEPFTVNRGTSTLSSSLKSMLVVDRWKLDGFFNNINAQVHCELTSTAADIFGKASMRLSGRITETTLTASAYVVFSQKIVGEDAAILGSGGGLQVFTLGYWIKTNNTGTYSVFFRNGKNTRSRIERSTCSLANTWMYKTHTVTADTGFLANWANSSTIGMHVGWCLGPTTTYGTTGAGAWLSGNFYGLPAQPSILSATGNSVTIYKPSLRLGAFHQEHERHSLMDQNGILLRYHQNFRFTHQFYASFAAQTSAIYVPFREQLRIDPPNFVKINSLTTLTNCSTPTFSDLSFLGVTVNVVSDATGQVSVAFVAEVDAEFP